jgi:hypothetical protein
MQECECGTKSMYANASTQVRISTKRQDRTLNQRVVGGSSPRFTKSPMKQRLCEDASPKRASRLSKSQH